MGLMKTLGNIGGSVIIPKGRVKTGFVWNCIIASVNCAVFIAAVRYGTGALAAAYSVLSLVFLVASFPSYYRSTIGLTPAVYVRSFAAPAAMSALMGAAVYGVHLLLGHMHPAPLAELALLIGFGAAVYLLLNLALAGKELRELFSGARPASVGTGESP
jgi:hypothetical protein